MLNPGFLVRMVGIFIIWMVKGFKGSFSDFESKHYKYDFIIGFIFLCLVAYLIYKFSSFRIKRGFYVCDSRTQKRGGYDPSVH